MEYTAESYKDIMTTDDYLDQEKMKSQSTVAISWLERHNDYLQKLENTYNNGSNTEMLGETYKGICKQCSNYVDVIGVLRSANDCDKMDHQYLKAVLGSMTFRGLTIISCACAAHRGEDNERSMAAADRYLASIAEDDSDRDWHNSCADGHDRNADSYKEEYERMEKYMCTFHSVNELTKTLFTLGNEYRAVAKQGMESIALAYNPATREYCVGDETWKAGLKELNEKYNNIINDRAKTIGESMSYEEATAILQKDAVDVSDVEYLALCYAFDGMSDEEVTKFIESAYIPGKKGDVVQVGDYTSQISVGMVEYKASETFLRFAAVYQTQSPVVNIEEFDEKLGATDDELQRKFRNSNILYIFSEMYPHIYLSYNEGDEVIKKDFSISISEISTNTWELSFKGNTTEYATRDADNTFQINKFHEDVCGDINETVKDLNMDEEDTNNIFANTIVNSIKFSVGLAETPGGIPVGALAMWALDELSLVNPPGETHVETTSNITLFNLSEGLEKLHIHATVINRRDDYFYQAYVTNVQYDSKYVQNMIDKYNNLHSDDPINCTPDELVQSVLGDSDVVDSETLVAFLDEF